MDLENYFKKLIGNVGDNAPDIAQIIPYLQYHGNSQQYQRPANNISAAMTDMNNPLYQQMYGQFKQQGQDNLAQTIAQLSGQNRKLSMMGRAPLFDAERGGETMFRGLTQGYQNTQNNASMQAFNQLNNAYKPAVEQGKLRQENDQGKTQAMGGLAYGLAKLFGL